MSINQIIQSVETSSAMIDYLYFAHSPYLHMIHSGTTQADSNELGSVSHSVDIGVSVLFKSLGKSTFCQHSEDGTLF